MTQKESTFGYKNVFWSGVTTIQLAKVIEASSIANLRGLYHLSNNKKISKYDLLCLFNKYCRKNEIEIIYKYEPMSDKTLICTRTDFSYLVPDYEEMIIEMIEWINSHKGIYGQYLGGF